MKIGGLQPVTLLDYPHKVAATIFASGCNMRCPFCYNPTLVLPELIELGDFLAEEYLFDFLEERKKYLDGVVLTGGEPTVQVDLIEFCQKIKKLGYALKLDTNGLLPDTLAELISQKLVDYMAMDLKGPLMNYEKFCGAKINSTLIEKSIELIKDSGLPYEFRSTLIKGWHQKLDLELMAQAIAGAKKYFLQNFNFQDRLVSKGFNGSQFNDREMEEWRELALKYVKECEIR